MDKEIKIAKSKGFNDSDIEDLVAVNEIKSGKEREFAKIMDKYQIVVMRKMVSKKTAVRFLSLVALTIFVMVAGVFLSSPVVKVLTEGTAVKSHIIHQPK